MYKYVVMNVAHAYGKTATFMPKPLVGQRKWHAVKSTISKKHTGHLLSFFVSSVFVSVFVSSVISNPPYLIMGLVLVDQVLHS